MTGSKRDNVTCRKLLRAVRATIVVTLEESLPVVGILRRKTGFYTQVLYGTSDILVQKLRTFFYSPAQIIEISGRCSIAQLIC